MPEGTPARDNSKLYIPAAIVIGALIIGISLVIGLSRGLGGVSALPPGESGKDPAAVVNIKDVKTAGDPYIGNANAPVVMAYWSDYQCPFCKAFEVGGVQGIQNPPVMPTLLTTYVQTGKLKIVFKDFPFLGKDSTTAAEYEHAIWELYPAQFYAWRTAMFKAQDQEGDQGFGNAATIDQLIGNKFPQMDDAKIKQTLAVNKAKYDAAIDADKQEGGSFGINGTPGFVTGTQLISGFESLATFTAAIDGQLK
jgi:protein-disulfide isomerase